MIHYIVVFVRLMILKFLKMFLKKGEYFDNKATQRIANDRKSFVYKYGTSWT